MVPPFFYTLIIGINYTPPYSWGCICHRNRSFIIPHTYHSNDPLCSFKLFIGETRGVNNGFVYHMFEPCIWDSCLSGGELGWGGLFWIGMGNAEKQ
jgi:hypothetical protein